MQIKSNNNELKKQAISGSHVVLGMDIVSFSTLHDDDQLHAIKNMVRWINEAIAYQSITQDEYRWSPAGDGGYLTFVSTIGSSKAIDIAFSIYKKVNRPDWVPRSGKKILMRMALHAGTVQEGQEFGEDTNIWGLGINITARILSVSLPSQLLVSKQYYDTYLRIQRSEEFEVGDVHWRTVKHGVQVEIMNINQDNLCLSEKQAATKRWRYIGGLWSKTIVEYKCLIHDAMCSGDPVAAIAAAKFLLDLDEEEPVWELCQMIGSSQAKPECGYPVQTHSLFSHMPPDVLMKIIRSINPKILTEDKVICNVGDPAESSYFSVSGNVIADVPGVAEIINIPTGSIIGEFSLWIPNLPRTAKLEVIGEGLLLEIHNKRFKEILDDSPDVADLVYGIIKRRIRENIINSNLLFPNVNTELREDISSIQAECNKYVAGSELDLSKFTYILFSGKVRIYPKKGKHLDLESKGIFGNESIVGILSRIGAPDGTKAKVLDDAVAVVIDHNILEDLQKKFDSVRSVWNSLCGKRLGDIEEL